MISPKLGCPDIGDLRARLDPDSGRAPDDRRGWDHLAACPSCRAEADRLRRDAELAAGAIDRLAPDALPSSAAIELARKRLAWSRRTVTHPPREAREGHEKGQTMPRPSSSRWRVALGGLAAAVAMTFVVGTPEGRTAAADLLAQFRSQRFAVVSVDSTGNRDGLAQLERLGTVQGNRPNKSGEEVRNVEEASRRVGFGVKQPDPTSLPEGVSRTPKVMAMPAHEVRFTFDRDKAREYFRSVGRSDMTLPDKYHGVSLVVQVPAAALLTYDPVDGFGVPSGAGRDLQKTGLGRAPGLAIGQSSEVKVGVDGNVPLEELRDYLLGLPGLPPETVQQLRAIQDWRNTLPIPVPVDRMAWQQASIGGGQGLLFADNTGAGSAAIWQRDGRIYGVAGAANADQLRRVADALR